MLLLNSDFVISQRKRRNRLNLGAEIAKIEALNEVEAISTSDKADYEMTKIIE